MSYILVNPMPEARIALIQLNRPKELNALNHELMQSLRDALRVIDADEQIQAVIITGNDQAFAAGADIKQMAEQSAVAMLALDQFSVWDDIKKIKKPIIAAVSGFALGGGCELAMLCDMIIASDTARFGQPEIKLGIIPGAGGTQRLTKAIGKAKAMELVLTGRFLTAEEAYHYGLVNKVVPVDRYLQEAIQLAKEISQMSAVAIKLAKESVNQAFETSLEQGILAERKNFYLTFASEDQKEGMQAFIEKRKPAYKGR